MKRATATMTCRIIPAGETNAGLVINRNVKTVIALVEKWPLSSVIVITFPSSDTSLCRIITFMAARMEKKTTPPRGPTFVRPNANARIAEDCSDLQGISQSATLPMLHTESHRIGGKAETEKEIET